MTDALSPAIAPAPLVRAQRVTQVAAALLTLFGVLVIAGWLLHLPVLLRIRPGHFAMVIGTAVCFVLTSLALLGTGCASTSR